MPNYTELDNLVRRLEAVRDDEGLSAPEQAAKIAAIKAEIKAWQAANGGPRKIGVRTPRREIRPR